MGKGAISYEIPTILYAQTGERSLRIIKEYMKRFWIEEKHRRDKFILKLEGNYLRSERSNNGFILLMALLGNCIEYLSHKMGVTFYEVVGICSAELIRHLFT